MAQRVSTGLAGLDAQLGGGIPPGTCHVVLGEPMNAQELLQCHFASAGTLLPGGCAYFSTDLSEAEVKKGIQAVGGKSTALKVTAMPGKDGWQVPKPRKGERIVYDSFSDTILAYGWQKSWQQLLDLRQVVRAHGDNLFISVTAGLHSEMERTLLKQWADGVMELGFDRQGFGLYPYLKVTKMRGVPESSRFLLFKETDKGLFMESTKRVF